MKKSLFFIALASIALITFSAPKNAQSQGFEVIAGNTFWGAATGAALGGATMGLKNDESLRPLSVGVGIGAIAGFGIGIYDLVQYSGAPVSGLINTSTTSTGIIILDTLYGAGTGGILGIAVALIGEYPIIKGIQYGASTGAWVGFGFGLIDAFVLGQHGSGGGYDDFDMFGSNSNYAPPGSAGLISIASGDNSRVSMINPVITRYPSISNQELTLTESFGVEVLKYQLRF